MIMSLGQRKIKFEPRIKLNHNIYTAISRKVVKRPKGSNMGVSIEKLHVLRYYDIINANLHVSFLLFSHAELQKNFPSSKTCDSKSKATLDIGLLKGKTNSSHAKIQTCSFPLGQYAKFH